jgi:hypothetical protein
MSTSFPGESKKYRAARDKLLQEEIELRRVTEALAAARRTLPSTATATRSTRCGTFSTSRPKDGALTGTPISVTPTRSRSSVKEPT